MPELLDLAISEYELRNKDHERKETIIWLAWSLYYTFLVSFIFVFLNENVIKFVKNKYYDCYILFFLTFIFIIVFYFILQQYWKQSKSIFDIKDLKKVIHEVINHSSMENNGLDKKSLKKLLNRIIMLDDHKDICRYCCFFKVILNGLHFFILGLFLFIISIIVII